MDPGVLSTCVSFIWGHVDGGTDNEEPEASSPVGAGNHVHRKFELSEVARGVGGALRGGAGRLSDVVFWRAHGLVGHVCMCVGHAGVGGACSCRPMVTRQDEVVECSLDQPGCIGDLFLQVFKSKRLWDVQCTHIPVYYTHTQWMW